MKPTTVVHIGSTRFHETFELMNRLDTLDHKIVLTVGCVTQSDDTLFAGLSLEEARRIKTRLDALHLDKIDRADEVLLLNKNWYLGPSTLHELCYAYNLGKPIRWLEEWTMYCPACRCEGPESEHFFHTRLSLHELGRLIEDEDSHPYLVGQLVDWYGLIAPVVRLADGTLALQVDVWCNRCRNEHETRYAVADPCDGLLFCITVDELGNVLADLRHEEGFVCMECARANRSPAPEYHRVLRHLTLRRADAPDETMTNIVSVVELPPVVRPLAATIAADDFDRLTLRKGLVELIITNLGIPVETGAVFATMAAGEERPCPRAESFDDMTEPHAGAVPASLFY